MTYKFKEGKQSLKTLDTVKSFGIKSPQIVIFTLPKTCMHF